MAYPHYHMTVPLLATNGDAVLTLNTATNVGGRWTAGPQSYIVRRVAAQATVTGVMAAAVISFRKVCGSAASATAGQFAKITFAATGQREDGMYFNDSFTPTKIPAGYGIMCRVTTGSTGKLFRAWAMIEPSPERLQNLGTGDFVSVTA